MAIRKAMRQPASEATRASKTSKKAKVTKKAQNRVNAAPERRAASGRVTGNTTIKARSAVKGRKNALKTAAATGDRAGAALQRQKMGDTLVRSGLATRNAKGVAVMNRSTDARTVRRTGDPSKSK